MHCSQLLPLLLAAGVFGSPILDGRNLPNGVKHVHSHMTFHKRDDDTPAEQMIQELEELGIGNPYGNSNPTPVSTSAAVVAAAPAPPPSTQPAAPVAPPSSTETVINANGEVEVIVYVGAVNPPANPVHNNPPANPVPQPAPVPKPASPPPQTQPQKQSQPPQGPTKPPSAPAPASPFAGMPSAPASFVEDLTGDDAVYKAIVLLHHNIHRTNHSLPLLEWNETLFEYAKASAQACVYEHTSPIPPYGQNIAAGNAPGNVSADLTNGFYNGEIGLFQEAIGEFGNDSPNMADFEHWGHATQMLWKDTTSVACYTASCAPAGADPLQCGPEGSYLKNVGCGNGGTRAFNLVCNYFPPGNYPNQYSSVPAPADKMGFVQMTDSGVVGLPIGV